jgi:hypothetical protein
MSDLWILINGFHIEIEVKTGTGQLSKPQKAWRNTVLKTGHHFIEARSVEQTIKEIGEIISGKRNT